MGDIIWKVSTEKIPGGKLLKPRMSHTITLRDGKFYLMNETKRNFWVKLLNVDNIKQLLNADSKKRKVALYRITPMGIETLKKLGIDKTVICKSKKGCRPILLKRPRGNNLDDCFCERHCGHFGGWKVTGREL